MKLVGNTNVLLQEKEIKTPKGKKAEPNTSVVGEAEVILSNAPDLKKGDKVIFNRLGILDVTVGKKRFVLVDINDVWIKL